MSLSRTVSLAVLLIVAVSLSIRAAESIGTWLEPGPDSIVVYDEDFSGYPVGALSEKYTAVQEYHWVEKNPDWGPWVEVVYWGFWPIDDGLAWHIREVNGQKTFFQKQEIIAEDRNALVLTGDRFWKDYAYEVEFIPRSTENPVGIVYRVENSRNFYMLSLEEGKRWVWTRRIHDAWYKAKVRDFVYQPGDKVTFRVEVNDRNHIFYVNGRQIDILRRDHHHPEGKVGLIANSPVDYLRTRVIMSNAAHAEYLKRKQNYENECLRLADNYPRPRLWKKIDLKKLAVNGRQMRWGDIDGDGEWEFVIAQRHNGANGLLRRYIQGMTAFELDGSVKWQWGVNDTIPELFATDLPFQIIDTNSDGADDIVFSYDFKIEVLDGKTGKTIRSVPTPKSGPKHPDSFYPENEYERIPAGAFYFCDLTGKGSPGDFIIKDDYNNIWAYNRDFEQLWTLNLNAGHYPYCRDLDNDGKDEVIQGYSLIDDDGSVIWDLGYQDHSDASFFGDLKSSCYPGVHAYFSAGEEGVIVSDMEGKVRYNEVSGHSQRMAIGDFIPEIEGCELAEVTYWGEHNIIIVHAADGRKLGEYQPHYIGSTLAAVDWVGDGTALLLVSGDEELGGMIDGWGRQVVRFTEPGHPVMACDAIDLTGDSRDEVLLWDRDQLWIYTQDSNVTAPEKIVPQYKMPIHSRSNYQMYVTIPE